MIPGSSIPVPNLEKTPYGDILGTGGNGKIVTYRLMGQDLAVKLVSQLYARSYHRSLMYSTNIILPTVLCQA